MDNSGFALFETPIGSCGIAWRGDRIVGTSLPESTSDLTARRITARFPDLLERAPSPAARTMIGAIVRLLEGEAVAFDTSPLDLDGMDAFEAAVYEVALAIPPGETRTYGDIARSIGAPGAARAVGRALGRNPFPIVIPCHRVMAAEGGSGGFSAPGGIDTKLKMLNIEGAGRKRSDSLFDDLPLATKPVRRVRTGQPNRVR